MFQEQLDLSSKYIFLTVKASNLLAKSEDFKAKIIMASDFFINLINLMMADRVTEICWAKMSPSQNKSQKTPFSENKCTVNNFGALPGPLTF